MSLFVYHRQERNMDCFCVVVAFTIEAIHTGGAITGVEGEITLKDYMEHGFEWTDKWKAVGILSLCRWKVRAVKSEDSIHDSSSPVFTSRSAINDEIEIFITEMLNIWFDEGCPNSDVLKEYDGPLDTYIGNCVCMILEESIFENPFPWYQITKGRFAERCFQCSCGKKWWLNNIETCRWTWICDQDAWDMLIRYNGVPVQMVAKFQEGAYLLQTIIGMGYVPCL